MHYFCTTKITRARWGDLDRKMSFLYEDRAKVVSPLPVLLLSLSLFSQRLLLSLSLGTATCHYQIPVLRTFNTSTTASANHVYKLLVVLPLAVLVLVVTRTTHRSSFRCDRKYTSLIATTSTGTLGYYKLCISTAIDRIISTTAFSISATRITNATSRALIVIVIALALTRPTQS